MDTSAKIINLLNRKASTVNELAAELSISRNSVHQQVSKLEAAGVVRKLHRSRPSGAGKPAFSYHTVGGNEDTFSTAYKPLADALIQALGESLPDKSRIRLLEKTGRLLARAAGLQPSKDLKADLEKAIAAVNSLGAVAELRCENRTHFISCFSCPLATLVHSDPATCRLVASFFSEATGRRVAVQCRREDTVVCGFAVE